MNTKAFHKIGYGLYVVSSKRNGKLNGQIANTVFQVTSEPPTIAVSINKKNLTHEFIESSKVVAISILSQKTPLEFIGLFGFKSGRDIDKFANVQYKTGVTGAPIVLENAVGYLEGEVIRTLDVGTHTTFIAKLVDAEVLKDEEPMTYAYYHEVKKGRSPKTAPTYIASEAAAEARKRATYRCTVCGYEYDPEKGDPDAGIKPGTPFEQLPADWVCPVCGAGKDAFEKVD